MAKAQGFTQCHVSIDVEAYCAKPLVWWNEHAKTMNDGRGGVVTGEQARDFFKRQLAMGHLRFPIGEKCTRWSWKKGCRGHRIKGGV